MINLNKLQPALALPLVLALSLMALPGVAADQPAPRISVSGQGSADLVPDMAVPAHVRNDSHPISFFLFPSSWGKDPYEIEVTSLTDQGAIDYNAIYYPGSVTGYAKPV